MKHQVKQMVEKKIDSCLPVSLAFNITEVFYHILVIGFFGSELHQ